MSASATALRRAIHTHPDLSGEEEATADRLRNYFVELGFTEIIEALGDTGLAVVIPGIEPGPTILLRAELDALPIDEPNQFAYRSAKPGVAHKCGHDGHMAILAEVGRRLADKPPAAGRVALLFQPAEETGKGALDVLADPRFAQIKPDQVYALHNLPGVAFGHVITRPGTFSCASRGMHIHLRGLETHAAQPEQGVSPGKAIGELLRLAESLGEKTEGGTGIHFATVTHISMGRKSFGIAPGAAHIMVTLRSEYDEQMSAMINEINTGIGEICS
ncbi:MAG: amidohydrolase, partial [Gammaproteobacteria bacterium]|nr:amidohydrolase [Gammaproteobacteria bacterium]